METKTEKIKIRIAVVVDSGGDWGAAGWHSAKESLQDCFDVCFDGLAENDVEEKWIIEAEIDVPMQNSRTIEGTATKQTKD